MSKYICVRADNQKQEIMFKVINDLQIELQGPRMSINGWHYFHDPIKDTNENTNRNLYPTYYYLIDMISPNIGLELIIKEKIISTDLFPHYVGLFQDTNNTQIVFTYVVLPNPHSSDPSDFSNTHKTPVN